MTVLEAQEIKLQREDSRVYLHLRIGNEWTRVEILDPVPFFHTGYHMAKRAQAVKDMTSATLARKP